MRDELESLINEKLNGINSSLEDMYTPYDEDIKQEIEAQNKKVEEEFLAKQKENIPTPVEEKQEEKKDVE